MPYKKGESGNPNGRAAGVPNKATKQIREMINDFLDSNFDNIVEAFNELQPREKVKFYIDLLQYGVPKLQSTDLKTDFDKLTDEQLDIIIHELKTVSYETI